MKKIVFISGSPRRGNTDFVLAGLHDAVNCEKEIIFIRQKTINHCRGCLNCYKNRHCPINDDMAGILEIISKADILVIGSPNYFDNVPGMLKDFMDRTAPCLGKEGLKNKKAFFVIVGGGRIENSEKVVSNALDSFCHSHKLKQEKTYCFKFTESREASADLDCSRQIGEIAQELNLAH